MWNCNIVWTDILKCRIGSSERGARKQEVTAWALGKGKWSELRHCPCNERAASGGDPKKKKPAVSRAWKWAWKAFWGFVVLLPHPDPLLLLLLFSSFIKALNSRGLNNDKDNSRPELLFFPRPLLLLLPWTNAEFVSHTDLRWAFLSYFFETGIIIHNVLDYLVVCPNFNTFRSPHFFRLSFSSEWMDEWAVWHDYGVCAALPWYSSLCNGTRSGPQRMDEAFRICQPSVRWMPLIHAGVQGTGRWPCSENGRCSLYTHTLTMSSDGMHEAYLKAHPDPDPFKHLILGSFAGSLVSCSCTDGIRVRQMEWIVHGHNAFMVFTGM